MISLCTVLEKNFKNINDKIKNYQKRREKEAATETCTPLGWINTPGYKDITIVCKTK